VLYGVLTSIAYAGFILLLRAANAGPSRPAGPLFDATLVTAAVCLAYGLVTDTIDLVPPLEATLWLVALALTSQVLGWLLISVSLPRLAAALASVLLLVQPAAAVLLAMVIVDEDPSALQLAGVLVVLAGVAVGTGAAAALARARRPKTSL
jgi:drug/metabolite transporter (DMT)-like permease